VWLCVAAYLELVHKALIRVAADSGKDDEQVVLNKVLRDIYLRIRCTDGRVKLEGNVELRRWDT
jgi:hypothetical protein